jgi:hypothetical protein
MRLLRSFAQIRSLQHAPAAASMANHNNVGALGGRVAMLRRRVGWPAGQPYRFFPASAWFAGPQLLFFDHSTLSLLLIFGFWHPTFSSKSWVFDVSEAFPYIKKPLCYIRKPFPYITKPLCYITNPLLYSTKPHCISQIPVPYITKPICHITKSFPYIKKQFSYITESFRYITKPLFYIMKPVLYITKPVSYITKWLLFY